jgi:RNA polymerase sigma factor (sigma-70 family)
MMRLPDDVRDDETLLEQSARDPDAFAVFYARHARTILAFFAARTREPEDAADLMAETLAAALLGASRFRRARGPALGWLFGIAQHKLTDSRRRGRVEHAARAKLGLERMSLDDDALARVTELIDVGRDPNALLALSELPATQREAVLAHVLGERDYRDIARDAACSEALIRQRVSRGLRALRHRLERST